MPNYSICPLCKNTFAKKSENVPSLEVTREQFLCPDCEIPFSGLWVAGWREGPLAQIIHDYKYASVRAASNTLADLLDQVLPSNVTLDQLTHHRKISLVPLPTIGRHIRARGLDHTKLLAQKLAKLRHWQFQPLLRRQTDSVQVGAKQSERQIQAAKAYETTGPLDPTRAYFLLDDVWTTGASMLAARQVLHAAGAKHIYGLVVAISKPKPSIPDPAKTAP